MEAAEWRIDALLSEWKSRTNAKQRVTGTRVDRALVQEGKHVGLTALRAVLRERRRRQAEAFVPLLHDPGGEDPIDLFEVAVDAAGGNEAARPGTSTACGKRAGRMLRRPVSS